MNPAYTREELRADIFEITTQVVTKAIDESNRKLIKMIDEDLAATNQRIDNLDRRLTKRLDKIETRLDKVEGRLDGVEGRLSSLEVESKTTNALLRQHDRRLTQLEILHTNP